MGSFHTIFTLKNVNHLVSMSEWNTCIRDSYQIRAREDMVTLIEDIREAAPYPSMAVCKRSMTGMVREWRAHNLLFEIGLFPARTKDVDLDIGNPWYKKWTYWLLSGLYSLMK